MALAAVGAVAYAPAAASTSSATDQQRVFQQYCMSCHSHAAKAGGLDLEALDLARVEESPAVGEKIVRKLRGGLMPPAGRPRPDGQTYEALASWLESRLDAAAIAHPNPGRT